MADPGYTPDPAKPDLSAFAAAVRFRDRATAAAVAYHERVGLQPSTHYARATFDAIAQMIREDEREKLAAAGRLVPPDTDIDKIREVERAAGRTAAAADIRRTHETWARTGKLAQWYLDGVADAASIADPEES